MSLRICSEEGVKTWSLYTATPHCLDLSSDRFPPLSDSRDQAWYCLQCTQPKILLEVLFIKFLLIYWIEIKLYGWLMAQFVMPHLFFASSCIPLCVKEKNLNNHLFIFLSAMCGSWCFQLPPALSASDKTLNFSTKKQLSVKCSVCFYTSILKYKKN